MNTTTPLSKNETCPPAVQQPPTIASLARPDKIWTLKMLTLTLERYESECGPVLVSLLTSVLKGLQELQTVSPRFAIQIRSAVPINPWATVFAYDCRITISLGEELPAPVVEADETHSIAREKMYQVLMDERFKDSDDLAMMSEFRALGRRGLQRKRVLMRRLRWLRLYEQNMSYTEKEELEWPLVKALEEGFQKELDGIDVLLGKVADATGVGRWVYWLRSE